MLQPLGEIWKTSIWEHRPPCNEQTTIRDYRGSTYQWEL